MVVRSLAASAGALLLLACKVYDPLYCSASDPCRDPARPFCDLKGEYPASEGIARTCIPEPEGGQETLECAAGTFQRCDGSNTAIYCGSDGASEIGVGCEAGCGEGGCLCEPGTASCREGVRTICGAEGLPTETEECSLGCNEITTRCNEIDPSNGLRIFLEQAANVPALTIPSGSTIDTDTGTILDAYGRDIEATSGIVSGSPAVRVYSVRALELGDVEVTGDLAIAFVSHGDVSITGHVKVRAGASAGPCEGAGGLENGGGSGGGGFGSPGGKGGAFESSEGGAGGVAVGNEELVPLLGGCSSRLAPQCIEGEYAPNKPTPAGGAIQLVSRTQVSIGGNKGLAILDAGGTGGAACLALIVDIDPSNIIYMGMGGGSGGGILIEAPIVELAAGSAIVANGGGGGCSPGGSSGTQGQDGQPSGQPAAGKICNEGDGRSGGDGASSHTEAGIGDFSPSSGPLPRSTGGGGGVGRIRVNSAEPLRQAKGSVVSPGPSLSSPNVY